VRHNGNAPTTTAAARESVEGGKVLGNVVIEID